MGTKARPKPQRLPGKLREIRLRLGLTLEQLVERFKDVPGAVGTGPLSRYETGDREPSLLILLAYAELVGISTDVLIDDRRDLPEKLKIRK